MAAKSTVPVTFHNEYVVAPLKLDGGVERLHGAAPAFHNEYVVAPLKLPVYAFPRTRVYAFHNEYVVAPLKPARCPLVYVYGDALSTTSMLWPH